MSKSSLDVISGNIKSIFCELGNVEHNPLLKLLKEFIFPVQSLSGHYGFRIVRPEKFGGDIVFNTYQEVEDAFKNKQLHPADLKAGVVDSINDLLESERFPLAHRVNVRRRASQKEILETHNAGR